MAFSGKSYMANRRRGQSMVEFAISFPFLLLLLVSIIFFGRYFLIAQVLLYAAQEGSKVAARTPGLSDPDVRGQVRGFTVTGAQLNPNSLIYTAIGSANLLSGGNTGSMPPGSRVEIFRSGAADNWDADGTTADTTAPGTIQVRIDYPFELIGNPFNPGASQGEVSGPVAIAMTVNGSKPPVRFLNFTLTERATAGEEIYQP
jgi:Flp pilus assembly protein TadG